MIYIEDLRDMFGGEKEFEIDGIKYNMGIREEPNYDKRILYGIVEDLTNNIHYIFFYKNMSRKGAIPRFVSNCIDDMVKESKKVYNSLITMRKIKVNCDQAKEIMQKYLKNVDFLPLENFTMYELYKIVFKNNKLGVETLHQLYRRLIYCPL